MNGITVKVGENDGMAKTTIALVLDRPIEKSCEIHTMPPINKKPLSKSKKTKKHVATESFEQAALFAWAKIAESKMKELEYLHSSQNGMASSSIYVSVSAKKAGMKKGVPDIFLPVPSGPYHGLFIELKRRNATQSALSAEQKKWLSALDDFGYRAIMCAGWEAAKAEIIEYLELKDNEYR